MNSRNSRLLLDSKIDLRGRGSKGETLLHLMDYDLSAETFSRLLQAVGSIDAQDNEGKTALLTAVKKNNIGVVRFLLKAGANPEIPDQFGLTPLSYAVGLQYDGVVQALLCHGAKANRQVGNDLPNSYLHLAIHQQSLMTVICLLRHKADPYFGYSEGMDALQFANTQSKSGKNYQAIRGFLTLAIEARTWENPQKFMDVLIQNGAEEMCACEPT